MSDTVQQAPAADELQPPPSTGFKRIAVIVMLLAVWLPLGALAGLLIGLVTGLIPFRC